MQTLAENGEAATPVNSEMLEHARGSRKEDEPLHDALGGASHTGQRGQQTEVKERFPTELLETKWKPRKHRNSYRFSAERKPSRSHISVAVMMSFDWDSTVYVEESWDSAHIAAYGNILHHEKPPNLKNREIQHQWPKLVRMNWVLIHGDDD